MTEEQFDSCPNCHSFPVLGLRSHPKFSTTFTYKNSDGDLDLAVAYFHTERENNWFSDITIDDSTIKQRWNHDSQQWEEYL